MKSSVITLIVPINAKRGKEDEVRKRIIDLAKKTRKEKGNINYILNEAVDKPGKFVIYENWKNQKALDFHMEQEYLQAFLTDSKKLLSGKVVGTFCKAF